MKPRINALLLFTCTSLLLSCKKNDQGTVCRLAAARQQIGSYDATTTLTYDLDGRVTSAMTTGSTSKMRVLTYSGDSVFVNESTSTGNNSYIAVRNSAGKITDQITRNSSGAVTVTVHYVYENGKATQKTVTYPPGAPLTYITVFNVDGDASTARQTGASAPSLYYTYYKDRAWQVGDPHSVDDFLNYGMTANTNNHLAKTDSTASGTSGGFSTVYNYTFDDNGNISRMTQSRSGSIFATNDYTYKCN